MSSNRMNREPRWRGIAELSNYELYMTAISIFGKAFVFLQIAKMVDTGSSSSVSFSAYVVYLVTSVSWLYFGLLRRDTVITVSGFIGLVTSLIALNTVVFYREDKGDLF